MSSKIFTTLFAAAFFLTFIAAVQFFVSRRRARKLTAMLETLYHGNLHAFEDFHFLDVQVNQLYFPFTEGELKRIRHCVEVKRHDLTVEITHPRQTCWDNYYFRILCDFEGVDDQYQPFSLRREGYLYISCTSMRGYWTPCITRIERRSKPFVL